MKKLTLEQAITAEIASNIELAKSIELFSNYVEHDTSRPCYVMVTDSEIVICNSEYVDSWRQAGYSVFGVAHNEDDLQEMIRVAEM